MAAPLPATHTDGTADQPHQIADGCKSVPWTRRLRVVAMILAGCGRGPGTRHDFAVGALCYFPQ